MTETPQGGRTDDRPSTPEQDGRDFARYAAVDLEDGQVLLYDIETPEAWIKSDEAIPREDAA